MLILFGGVGPAINDCGEACEKFQKQLNEWVTHEPANLRERVRMRLHRAEISRLTFTILTTERRLEPAMGLLTL
jgi:hypothetical protein